MESTREDLSARLDRLERDVRELSSRARAMAEGREDLVNRITFTGWLRISGPTFATMVFGFVLLWNAQQATTAQLLEASRSAGRLEGSIAGLDARVARLEGSIAGLDARVGKLDGAVQGLDARVARLEGSIAGLDARVGKLDGAIQGLDARVGRLEGSIGRLDAGIERLGSAIEKLSERVAPAS